MTERKELTSTEIQQLFPSWGTLVEYLTKFWTSQIYKDHIAKQKKAMKLLAEEDKQYEANGVFMCQRVYKNKVDAHMVDKYNLAVNSAIDNYANTNFANNNDKEQPIKKINNMIQELIKIIQSLIEL